MEKVTHRVGWHWYSNPVSTTAAPCVLARLCWGVRLGDRRAERGPDRGSCAHLRIPRLLFPQKSGHWEHAGKADGAPSCSWMLFVLVSSMPLLHALLFLLFSF